MREAKDRISSQLYSGEEIVFLTDGNGRISGVNEKAVEIVGQSRIKLLGQNLDDLLEHESKENFKKEMKKVWAGLFHKTPLRFAGNASSQAFQASVVPLNMANATFSMSGTMNCKVDSVENVTVPAGTYKAFKLEISTSDLQASSQGVDVSMNVNGQVHMEYGTCQLVDLNMQATESFSGTSMSLTMSVNLTGDTKS